MKINKKYLAGSVAVLALSVCSYELGRYQAGQDKKESNRVAYIDGDQA
ncbi:pneumococcal-type histidine triad protein, partial [Streptococcus pneumoniae]